MTTQYLLSRDIAGYPTTGEQTGTKFTDTAQYFTLTASTVENVTVPRTGATRMLAKFKVVSLTQNAVVWVLPAASPTLTLPTGTVTATTATMNPSAREVVAGQSLQLLTSQADVSVSIEYYEIL